MRPITAFLSFVLITLWSSTLHAQYRLPRLDLLADEGVREIVVTKTPLRMVNLKGEDITTVDFDTTTATIKRYVVNAFGKIDSMIEYPSEKDFYRMTVIAYDDQGRANEVLTLNREKMLEARTLIEREADGSIYSRSWEYGELRSEAWINADSITIKSVSSRLGSTSIFTYDVEKDIDTDQWFKDGELIREEILDWDNDRGLPTVMHHSFYEIEEGKKPTSWQKTFEVNAKGQVVNKYMEFFYDPFLGDNFFERHRKFKGVLQPDAALFTVDSIITTQEQSELWTYDGDEIVYRYGFVYGK